METPKVRVGFGVMILKDNKILLGQRHLDSAKASSELHGEGTWTMPGGKLHFGESFEEGAAREVFEEIGVQVLQKDFEVISFANDMVPDAHFVTIGIICRNFSGEPKVMEPDEITQWKWFSLDSLPTPLYKASEKILLNYKEGKFYKY